MQESFNLSKRFQGFRFIRIFQTILRGSNARWAVIRLSSQPIITICLRNKASKRPRASTCSIIARRCTKTIIKRRRLFRISRSCNPVTLLSPIESKRISPNRFLQFEPAFCNFNHANYINFRLQIFFLKYSSIILKTGTEFFERSDKLFIIQIILIEKQQASLPRDSNTKISKNMIKIFPFPNNINDINNYNISTELKGRTYNSITQL